MYANKKKRLLTLVAGVTAAALLMAPVQAMAQLDELLRDDMPYMTSPESTDLGEETASRLYSVQPGDTLSNIAQKFGLDMQLLAAANGLSDTDMIVSGQVLTVPGNKVSHKVQPGETLWDIAYRYRVPVTELIAYNNLKDENTLYSGDNINVPIKDRSMALPAWNSSRSLPVGELIWPTVGWVSSPFGLRDGRPHEGIDLAADQGEPIKAAKAGRVVFSGPRGTYGLAVIIDHGDGLRTLYGHASELLVKEGEWVETGQQIAKVGSTGRSTGPHLHLEVLLNGVPCDPMQCLNRSYA